MKLARLAERAGVSIRQARAIRRRCMGFDPLAYRVLAVGGVSDPCRRAEVARMTHVSLMRTLRGAK